MNQSEHYIEDKDKLFYHVPKSLCREPDEYLEVSPHAFNPVGESLSTNWEKFCNAEGCLNAKTLTYPEGRTSLTHGVGHFLADDIRNNPYIKGQLEIHYIGNENNKSHVGIFGIPLSKDKKPYNAMKVQLQRMFRKWDIKPIDK